jgi:hypothetical protein
MEIAEPRPFDPPTKKEYLSLEELVEQIPYRPQTIRNLICQGVLKEGVHYFKPTPRMLVFKWSAIREWIEGEDRGPDLSIPLARGR